LHFPAVNQGMQPGGGQGGVAPWDYVRPPELSSLEKNCLF